MDLNQKQMTALQIEHVEHLEGIRSMLTRLDEAGGRLRRFRIGGGVSLSA